MGGGGHYNNITYYSKLKKNYTFIIHLLSMLEKGGGMNSFNPPVIYTLVT